jgi:hypothetical protein
MAGTLQFGGFLPDAIIISANAVSDKGQQTAAK